MGRKIYSGGGTVLSSEAAFTTYDPAEEQKHKVVTKRSTLSLIDHGPSHSKQVEVQLRILLRHVLKGRTNPYIPVMFRDEIKEFASLSSWAHSKQEYQELSGERCRYSKRSDNDPPVIDKVSKLILEVAKINRVARMKPDGEAVSRKTSTPLEGTSPSSNEQLAEWSALMDRLRVERRQSWYPERKKRAITERYHSIKKKYDALWSSIYGR